MAEQNMGGIYYTIDANTKEYIDQTNQTIAANRKMGKSFDGVDGAVKKSNQGMASFGRGAGQVGIQVQQLVGQIQGGQNAFQAFGAQAADIGIVLGAPLVGVIAALGAAVAGTLLPSLFDSTNATEDLEDALESIEKVIKVNSDGVNVLSNDYAELVKKSKDLAKSQLLLAKVRVDQIMNKAADAAEDAFDKFDTFFNALDVSANVSVFDTLDEALQRTGMSVTELIEETDLYGTGLTQLKSAIENVNSELGLTTEQSALVLRKFAEIREQKTPEALNALSTELLNIAETSRGKVTPEFVELVSLISSQAFAAKNAAEQSKLLEDALNGIGIQSEGTAASLSKWNDVADRLAVRSAGLRSEQLKLEKALAIKQATEDGANKTTITSIGASYDKMIANERESESEKALSSAKREKAAAEREAAAAARESAKASAEASKSFITGFGVEGEDFNGDNPDSMATGFSRSISAENETVLEQLQRQREMIQLYQELEIGDAQAHADALVAISEKEAQEKQRINSQMLSAYSSFFGESAGLVEAFAGESSGAYKALFAVSKGFAIANAALQLQTAIANAMAVPFPANIPLIAQAVSLGGQVASSIAGINYGGGRATGGPVSASSMYRMGEGNRPEVLQTGAGMFAVPGDSGRVFNQSQLDKIEGGSGGGMPNITINNQPGVVSTVLSADEKEVIINSAVNRAENNYVGQMNNKDGKMFNANSRNFGSGKTSGRPQ